MSRQPRTLYHVQMRGYDLTNATQSPTICDLDYTYTYDADDATDEAFNSAYTYARSYQGEITCTNAKHPNFTYTVYFPTYRTRIEYVVMAEDDGIDL